MRARALVAAAALLVGACAIPVGNTGRVLDRRLVAAKDERTGTLTADDGTQCRVSGDALARAQVGRAFTCLWDDRLDAPPRGRDGARPARRGR